MEVEIAPFVRLKKQIAIFRAGSIQDPSTSRNLPARDLTESPSLSYRLQGKATTIRSTASTDEATDRSQITVVAMRYTSTARRRQPSQDATTRSDYEMRQCEEP